MMSCLFWVGFRKPRPPGRCETVGFQGGESSNIVGGFNLLEKYWSNWIISPGIGVKIKNIGNHHPVKYCLEGFSLGLVGFEQCCSYRWIDPAFVGFQVFKKPTLSNGVDHPIGRSTLNRILWCLYRW